MNYIHIEEKILTADIVLTAEGSLDFQTPNGKIPSEVARIAKKYDIPVIALTGTIGKGAAFKLSSRNRCLYQYYFKTNNLRAFNEESTEMD